ncbi:sensor domain-containing diguanylate cyclase [Shewanella sp. OMA3-2]|uniref:sensor domain-containing diguanylate cyclase n=1 Tax=Shewanella sp. OMA3-2 TaxID=2908650 RepID=UPI001F210B34|nr:diguanylate cyclase [Shewanella sp. OMA3-2]UJF20463.1 sensor domain-containing diguanylate cyclase [Shewanella sp. OMA3-2]
MLFLLFYSCCVNSKAIELHTVSNELLINKHLNILQDSSTNLSYLNALKQYQQGKFTQNVNKTVSFGFTHDVLWASILINNSSTEAIKKVFYLDSAWLDHANFYFIHQNKLIDKTYIGDALPYSARKNQTRMLSQPHEFKPGITQVMMRFESNDPLLIPLYLSTEAIIQDNLILSSYFYGFLYGAFFILFVYNIALFISLKDASFIFYALYLLSFLSLNIAYTGHGFKFIWPDNIFLQQWLMTIFLYFYIIFGIAFCFEFLKLKVFSPQIYKMKRWIYTSLVLLMVCLFINADQLLAVEIAVALTSLLVVIFVSLGFLALNNGHKMVKFFIPAVFMGAGGAAISAATTGGVIPYNTLLFHSIEVGMLIEMSILALALAFNLKEVDKARITAEVTAQIDHLTALYNRRAFTAAADPLWNLGIKDKTDFSIILLDIDWFKKINDEHGHAAGDAVLKRIASTLNKQVRKNDILARWGGEEFIIFLPNTSKMAAVKLANVIRNKIAEMIVLHDEGSLSVTASLGVAEFNDQMHNLEDLIKLADIALYKAKHSGRNTVCEMPELSQPKHAQTQNSTHQSVNM